MMGTSSRLLVFTQPDYFTTVLFPKSKLRRVLTLAGAVAVLSWSGGCASVKNLAIKQVGKALADGTGGAFAAEEDVEFAGQAIPFSLKLIESLLEAQPDNVDLLFAAASGFTQYSYVWVQQEADFLEDESFAKAQHQRDRAQAFYLRAHRYARRALAAKHRGFDDAFSRDPVAAVATMKRDDVPLLYWAATSLGGAIALGKSDPGLIARQPQMEALLDRASALDPDWSEGALHELHASYEPARPGAGADVLERSRRHLERAMELQGEARASVFVSYAESISVAQQNRAEFVRMLNRALAVDVNARPESRLANIVMHQRARWLLARADDLFLDPAPTSNPP